jgi:hypothetical protein
VRKIEGHLRLAFAHWDIVLPRACEGEGRVLGLLLLPLALLLLKHLYAPEDLRLEPFYVEV